MTNILFNDALFITPLPLLTEYQIWLKQRLWVKSPNELSLQSKNNCWLICINFVHSNVVMPTQSLRLKKRLIYKKCLSLLWYTQYWPRSYPLFNVSLVIHLFKTNKVYLGCLLFYESLLSIYLEIIKIVIFLTSKMFWVSKPLSFY